MSSVVEEKESRRIQRIALPLPTRVEVNISPKNSWNEVTRLSDISAFGAGFSLKRPVKRGRLVLLTIPMPRQLRVYDFTEEQYRIWACVRRCLPVSTGPNDKKYVIGVAFIGKPYRRNDLARKVQEVLGDAAVALEHPPPERAPRRPSPSIVT